MPDTWISVDDCLPDDDETVIVATPEDSDPVWLGYLSGDDWYSAEGVPVVVTHWMPLPEPPEVK